MNKPAIKKSGSRWACSGAGISATGKTPGASYTNWYRAIAKEVKGLRLSLMLDIEKRKGRVSMLEARCEQLSEELLKEKAVTWKLKRPVDHRQAELVMMAMAAFGDLSPVSAIRRLERDYPMQMTDEAREAARRIEAQIQGSVFWRLAPRMKAAAQGARA